MRFEPEDATPSSGVGDELAGGRAPIVVGIGGSAGALGALMTLLEGVGDAPVAIVAVLQLAPDHESHAVEILQRVTPLKVTQVVVRTRLQAGNVYVLAPGKNLITGDGHVQPARPLTVAQRPASALDRFFRRLGHLHRDRAICIVLSGTGRDGSLGLAHVRACGGLTIAQSPDDCEFPEMPQAAIQSGCVDLALSAAEIGKRLVDLAIGPPSFTSQKYQFLAVVSHELKQSLNLLQFNAELLVRLPEARGMPAVQRIGETLMQAVAAQETIVNDLLDLSRIQTGKLQLHREPTDLAARVLRLSQAFAGDAASKKIELVVDAPDVVVCDCDPVRMEQIVWNLLGNALKFTGQGGRIRIRVAAEGDKARLTVADNGIGIAPSHLPRVFDLFDQGGTQPTGTQRTGLGIGLALVRELVQAHGGRIQAASPGEGLGATFTVEIALSARLPSQIAQSSAAPLNRRILVIDDSADNLLLFAELLRLEGAQVDATTRPTEALDMLAHGEYDLVLSDIGMPGMSGLELMKQARALHQGNRFRSIAISGYDSDADKAEALAAGFDGHLCKPVSIERLRALLDRLGR